MADLVQSFAAGFDIGSTIKARHGQKKMTEGLIDYRKELEADDGAMPTGEDPGARLARMQQAETKFYDGVKSAGLDMEQTTAAMTSFNGLKSQYVLKESGTALAAWDTPDIAAPSLKRTLESLQPGRRYEVKALDHKDESGKALYHVSFDDDNDPKTPARQTVVTYEQSMRMAQAVSAGPDALMNLDKNALELNASIAKAQQDTAESQSKITRNESAAEQATSAAELNRAKAGTEAVRQKNGGVLPTAGKAKANAAVAMVQSTQLSDDLLDFEPLAKFRETNPGKFDDIFVKAYGRMKEANGVEPTRRQVLDALQQSMPAQQ